MSSGRKDGLALKIRRIKRGLMQYQLAAALGIAPQRLSLIECGRIPVTPVTAERIIDVIESWPLRPASSLEPTYAIEVDMFLRTPAQTTCADQQRRNG